MFLRWCLVNGAFVMSHRTLYFGRTLIGWLYKCWALHTEVENLEKFLRMSSKIVSILNNWGPSSSSILLFLYDDVFYIPIAGRHASDCALRYLLSRALSAILENVFTSIKLYFSFKLSWDYKVIMINPSPAKSIGHLCDISQRRSPCATIHILQLRRRRMLIGTFN